MLREVGIALFLAAVGLGAGDGFIDAIVGGGYRWIGYGALITVTPVVAGRYFRPRPAKDELLYAHGTYGR